MTSASRSLPAQWYWTCLLYTSLPGDDGYTILEQLKSMPSVKDVPVIMVTAKEAEFDKVDVYKRQGIYRNLFQMHGDGMVYTCYDSG